MSDDISQLNFGAAANLYKWPSLGNARREDRAPYMVSGGTLDECIQQFMAKPENSRHLYEIRTPPQTPLISNILSPEHIIELSRLRDFL